MVLFINDKSVKLLEKFIKIIYFFFLIIIYQLEKRYINVVRKYLNK